MIQALAGFARKRVEKRTQQVKDLLGMQNGLVEQPWVKPRVERVIDAMGMTLFPPGGAIPFSAEDVELTDYMVGLLGKIDPVKSDLLTVLFLVYEYAIPKLYGKMERFSDLPEHVQLDLMEKLHECPFYILRLLTVSVRMLFTFGYTADERVLEDIGFFKRYEYPADLRNIMIKLESIQQEQSA
mgnify:CR=1 FL=1